MEIKICGIRRKEDIDIINKYKPDYIGFIFAKSKREVTPETVAEITKNLDTVSYTHLTLPTILLV